MNPITIDPIGQFFSLSTERYELPRQPSERGLSGKIVLLAGHNFEMALDGLSNFDRIWVLFIFDRAKGWRPKILPTRSQSKVGVFASRAPYRPVNIGMSCVILNKIQGRTLFISGCDMLHLTPIIDIKPYIPQYDSFPKSSSGWVENLSSPLFKIVWTSAAQEQRKYLEIRGVVFSDEVFSSLQYFSGPNHYNRIKILSEGLYVIAYKQWRFTFSTSNEEKLISIHSIQSGFRIKEDMDSIHREFFETFYGNWSIKKGSS